MYLGNIIFSLNYFFEEHIQISTWVYAMCSIFNYDLCTIFFTRFQIMGITNHSIYTRICESFIFLFYKEILVSNMRRAYLPIYTI